MKNRFKNLPSWTWETVDMIAPKEKRWEQITKLLNRGTDHDDVVYWSTVDKIDEYHSLRHEKEKLEIGLSQAVSKLCDRLVEWRDTTYPIEDYYDGDQYFLPDIAKQIQNEIAYFYIDITGNDWFKSGFSTPESTKRTLKSREINRKKIINDIK